MKTTIDSHNVWGQVSMQHIMNGSLRASIRWKAINLKQHFNWNNNKDVGPVYKISCDECEATYAGEIEHSLKTQCEDHRRLSSTTSEVSKHIHLDSPSHTILQENTKRTQMVWKGSKGGNLHPGLETYIEQRRWTIQPVWNNIIKERWMEHGAGATLRSSTDNHIVL